MGKLPQLISSDLAVDYLPRSPTTRVTGSGAPKNCTGKGGYRDRVKTTSSRTRVEQRSIGCNPRYPISPSQRTGDGFRLLKPEAPFERVVASDKALRIGLAFCDWH